MPVWKLTAVVGADAAAGCPSATPTEAAIALVGTTSSLMEFKQAAPRSAVIASDEQFLLKLASQAEVWLTEQLAAGTIAQEGEWYTVV